MPRSYCLPAVLAAAFFSTAGFAGEQPRMEELLKPAAHGRGSLAIENRGETRIPVLTLVGGPAERGEQQGTLLRPALLEMETWIQKNPMITGAMLITPKVQQRLIAGLPASAREETEAMARASGMALKNAMFLQVASDVFKAFGCSVVVADERAAGGGYLFGRNMDYQNFSGRMHETSVIYRVTPEKGYRYAAVGFLGQTGVLSAMNEKGLTLTVTEIDDGPLAEGQPYMSRYRDVIERCATFDEALALIKSQKITTNNSLVVADASGAMGVIEQAPEKVMARRPAAGQHRIHQTNHFMVEEMRAFEGNRLRARASRVESTESPAPGVRDISSRGRFNALGRVCAARKPGEVKREDVIQALVDAHQDDATLHSMIFHPAVQSLEVAFGRPPTATLPFHRFSRDFLFAPVPAATAPPPAAAKPVDVTKEDEF